MKAVIRKNKLVIEIPLKNLKFGVENNPEYPLRVTNVAKLGRWFARNILEFNSEIEAEPDFIQLLDRLALDAYEAGEPWVHAVNEEES